MVKLSLGQIANRLNAFLTQDPVAFNHLVELRVDCGPLYAINPRIDTHKSFYDRPLMGTIELLNSLFDDDQSIATVRSSGQVKRFTLQPRRRTPIKIPVVTQTKVKKTPPVKKPKPDIKPFRPTVRSRGIIKEFGLF